MRVWPFTGAVQRNQTERPPCRPVIFGSPASLVALVATPFWPELPLVVAEKPLKNQALAKLSLAGWAWAARTKRVKKRATKPTRITFFMGITAGNLVQQNTSIKRRCNDLVRNW